MMILWTNDPLIKRKMGLRGSNRAATSRYSRIGEYSGTVWALGFLSCAELGVRDGVLDAG
jgi:hypothetical protein